MERRVLGGTGISVSEIALDAGVNAVRPGRPDLRAVSAVLLGPRTMEQLESLLAGVGTVLDDDLLDRIDAIVAPGTEINPLDNYYTNPDLDRSRRRR